MNTAVIGLGSNIEPNKNIQLARQKIQTHFQVLKTSQFRKTKPIGFLNQADFINGAILIQTELNRNDLERQLKSLEHDLGREREGNKYGPRTIDLDILIWNKEIVDKDVYKRDFLKQAIQEIDPGITIP